MKSLIRATPEPIKGPLRRLLNMLIPGSGHASPVAQRDWEKVFDSFDPHFHSALVSMYRGDPQFGSDGHLHPIDNTTKVSHTNGLWLYDFCLSVKPKMSIEIGMAYGFSSLFIMAAMYKNGIGCHTAIDPFQNSNWNGIGLSHAQNASEQGVQFSFIEDRSDHAAADLARADRKFELIFIDGNHKFDDVLVDFYLYAPLCSVGGHIIFDDANLNSIQSVIAFVRANRADFTEIRDTPNSWCVFRRTGDDQRHWKHFRRFPVATDSNPTAL